MAHLIGKFKGLLASGMAGSRSSNDIIRTRPAISSRHFSEFGFLRKASFVCWKGQIQVNRPMHLKSLIQKEARSSPSEKTLIDQLGLRGGGTGRSRARDRQSYPDHTEGGALPPGRCRALTRQTEPPALQAPSADVSCPSTSPGPACCSCSVNICCTNN